MKVPPHTHPFKRHRHVHRHKLNIPGINTACINTAYTEMDEPITTVVDKNMFPEYESVDFERTMESGLYDEMGDFFDTIGDVVGGLTGVVGDVTGLSTAAKGLGSVLGLDGKKKKKKKKAPAIAPQPQFDMSQLANIIGQAQSSGEYTGPSAQEIQYIIKDMLSSIAPPVRQKLREVINEMKGTDASEENLIANIEHRVGSNIMPQLNKAIQALKLAQTQTEATSEHREIMKNEDRWRENRANQQQLLNRIAIMEKRIADAMKKRR